MLHLAANFVSLANVANTDTPALNDTILAIQNGHHIPSKPLQLVGAWASSTSLLRARLTTPKIRQVAPTFLHPVENTITPVSIPAVMDMSGRPFNLNAQEEIVWELTASAAGPANAYVISWLQDGLTPAPQGDMYTVRATGTTTTVASTWTPATVTFDSTLPAGLYSVVGAQLVAATTVAFSLTFDNQFYRPGGLASTTDLIIPWMQQRYGGLGEWGRFDTVTLPRLSILSNVGI